MSRSAASTVLVLTQPGDTTADLVIAELHERAAPVLRMDTGDFPAALSVAARFDDCWHGEIRGRQGSVELSDIYSIYVRRPSGFVFPSAMTDAEQRFASREARRGVAGVLMSLPCLWMNHPSRSADAEYKPLQLAVAAACGLTVPSTVVTNSPDDADRNHAYLGADVVYKTFASASVADGANVSLIYTNPVTVSDMADARVSLTAHQFQRRIPKVRDVRATVVGTKVLAANIATSGAGGPLDWRANYSGLRYEPVRLPPDVESSLLAMTDRLGLSFAAADFVVTADDRHYFIDLNPGGQWAWIQDATELPIASAIAEYLTGADQ